MLIHQNRIPIRVRHHEMRPPGRRFIRRRLGIQLARPEGFLKLSHVVELFQC